MGNIVLDKYITIEESNNEIRKVEFSNANDFNFAFHIIDEIAKKEPDKIAMIYVSQLFEEKRITYKDLMLYSNQIANYLKSEGIRKGDRLIVALQRAYQFWYVFLALNKIGAIPVPVVSQLREKDIRQRVNLCDAKAVICINNDEFQTEVEKVEMKLSGKYLQKFTIRGEKKGWIDIEKASREHSNIFDIKDSEKVSQGRDTMFMLFTSGTSGNLKLVAHDYRYPLTHYITAAFWNRVETGNIHWTISDSGWGKALWGKLFGPWLIGGIVFVYDYKKFDVFKILDMIRNYQINTLCMPPTMYRMLLDKNVFMEKYFDSVIHACSAGETLPVSLINKFYMKTGVKIVNGYGQTETGLLIANFNSDLKKGSLGKPNPIYKIKLLKEDGEVTNVGEIGEIVIDCSDEVPIGLATNIKNNSKQSLNIIEEGYYHTGDLASMDRDGEYWYKGRNDSIIKSSGYRISPYEIENIIEELTYVRECKVYGIPDLIRGIILKADVVLENRDEGNEELKLSIQNYVKRNTAPYKYPRVIEFVEKIERTISGKKMRGRVIGKFIL